MLLFSLRLALSQDPSAAVAAAAFRFYLFFLSYFLGAV